MDDFDALKDQIVRHLVQLGWTDRSGWGAGIAGKDFTTAVGPKEAQAYAFVSEGEMVMKAQYWSEGRNALSTLRVAVAPDADPAAVLAQVERFSTEVDQTVAQTYACRLLRTSEQDGDAAP